LRGKCTKFDFGRGSALTALPLTPKLCLGRGKRRERKGGEEEEGERVRRGRKGEGKSDGSEGERRGGEGRERGLLRHAVIKC